MRSPVILVTGKNGQLGWEIQRTLMPLGKVVAVGRDEMDLSDVNSIKNIIEKVQPDVIVNTAAYTAVDKAQEESELANKINAIAPEVMANEAKRIGALLIHYSTDYVFNGDKSSPYLETDATAPINVYGESKLSGERNVQNSGADCITLRTSWVYSHRGQNFLKSILKLAAERKELGIVNDQIGAPTSARFIAEVSAHVIKQSLAERRDNQFESGLYHLVCEGRASWFDFASKIVELADKNKYALKIKKINPIPGSEYPTPAKRPLNSCLSTLKLATKFNVVMIPWDECLKYCMNDLR